MMAIETNETVNEDALSFEEYNLLKWLESEELEKKNPWDYINFSEELPEWFVLTDSQIKTINNINKKYSEIWAKWIYLSVHSNAWLQIYMSYNIWWTNIEENVFLWETWSKVNNLNWNRANDFGTKLNDIYDKVASYVDWIVAKKEEEKKKNKNKKKNEHYVTWGSRIYLEWNAE